MTIETRLKGLKALAERGVGGEKENAAILLKKLCEKYSISIDEIESSEKIETHWFRYTGGDLFRQLLLQCLYKTMGGNWNKITYKQLRPKKTRCIIGVDCTFAQAIEIDLDYAFFSHHLKTDLQRVTDMFIQRNYIFAPDGPVDDGTNKLSEADIQLALSLKKHTRTLQIEKVMPP